MQKIQELITKTTHLSGIVRSYLNRDDSKLYQLVKSGLIKLKEHTDSIEFIYSNNYNGFLLICSLQLLAYKNCENGVRVQYRFEFTDRFDSFRIPKSEIDERYCRKDLELINSETSQFSETLMYARRVIKEFVDSISSDKSLYYNTRNKNRFQTFQDLGSTLERITLSYEYLKDMKPYIKWYNNKKPDEHYYFDNKVSLVKVIKNLFQIF